MIKKISFIFILCLWSIQGWAYQPAVVSASPEASKIGLDILEKGGSAADAAVATAFALSVAEPYYSGLGGGGFLLYYEAKTKKLYFVDYREVAPMKVKSKVYKKDPKKLYNGIHSVAVPGFVLGMETIHKKWRKVSWPAVLEPSIDLAKKGVLALGRIKTKVESRKEWIQDDPRMKEIFINPIENHDLRIFQMDLAKTLENIKTGGARVFYRGGLADKIIKFSDKKGGTMSLQDLKKYRVLYRKPYSFPYGKFQIHSAPLPSSGGRGLNYLFLRSVVHKADQETRHSSRAYELLLEGIIDYFQHRSLAWADTSSNIVAHTTHISVIDAEGNMAAMTNTLNYAWGSGLMVPGTGIILNNEMGDFSLDPLSANRIAPGHRPLSSMSPTIVFENEKPKYVIGTPGGQTIPVNLFQILYMHWQWKVPLVKAMQAPKFYYKALTKQVVVEKKFSKKVKEVFQSRYEVIDKDSIGNVQTLIIENDNKTKTLSDKRGEGKGYVLKQ